MAVTDPLPLVPATCRVVKLRSGWPSASQRREMFSSPSLMPKVSSEESRSSNAWSARRCRHGDAGLLRHPGRRQLCSHEAQRTRHDRLHVPAVHDQIEHAVLDQELAPLKAVRQLLADGLLDDAGTGKADERLRFGDVEVAEHREA